MSLPPYRKIYQSTWSRQDHYKYYTEKLKVNYSMTARLDVTRLRAECDRFGVHFYAAFIWCTSNVVNRLPFMKMMTDEEGNPGVWDVVHPNYTIFHKEDHTFSDCWSEYDADSPGSQSKSRTAGEFLLHLLCAVAGLYRICDIDSVGSCSAVSDYYIW